MLTLDELALLRGWIQGISWGRLGGFYLHGAERGVVHAIIDQLRHGLAIKARQVGRWDLAKFWYAERRYNDLWQQRALQALETLHRIPDPKPTRDDSVRLWFPEGIAKRLEAAKLESVRALLLRIEKEGVEWWRPIPRVGAIAARDIRRWLREHAVELGVSVKTLNGWYRPRQPSFAVAKPNTNSSETTPQTAIVPLERFLVPDELNGASGTNRAAGRRCPLDARDDYQAIQSWLKLWPETSATYRAYRKEAERFLLWAILERGRAFSSLNTPDCNAYRKFLKDPRPAKRWVGPLAPRWTPAWKPFQGPLSAASIRHAETVLKVLCNWLMKQRYLETNPFAGLTRLKGGTSTLQVNRSFSETEWTWLMDYCAARVGEGAQPDPHTLRIQFILRLAYGTGLRLEELAKATVGDLEKRSRVRPHPEQWWLSVTGKGGHVREVPIPAHLVGVIRDYWDHRDLNPNIEAIDADTPLIGKRRKHIEETAAGIKKIETPLSASGLHQILKAFFIEAGEVLSETEPEAGKRLMSATTHWLRHTHGSHAVARQVDLPIVRDNLGHRSIATTSSYVHADADQRYAAMGKLGDSA